MMRCLPILLLLLGACPVLAAEDSLPADVRSALSQNSADLSPITLSWTEQYQPAQSAQFVAAQLHIDNPADNDLFAQRTLRVAWQNGRVYCLRKQNAALTYEYSFDGNILYVGNPNVVLSDGTPQPRLGKNLASQLARDDPAGKWIIDDYFDAAGFCIPSTAVALDARQPPASAIMHQLAHPGSHRVACQDVTINEHPLKRIAIQAEDPQWRAAEDINLVQYEQELRLTLNPEDAKQRELAGIRKHRQLPHERLYEYYLDPKLAFAVVRRDESYPDGTLLVRVINDQFARLKGRHAWLPRACRVDYYTWTSDPSIFFKTPIIAETMNVSSIDLQSIPDSQFIVDYKIPGTIIIDQTAPGPPNMIQVPATPKDLDVAIDKERAFVPQQNPDAGFAFWRWIVIAVLVLPLMAFVWRWLKHGQKTH